MNNPIAVQNELLEYLRSGVFSAQTQVTEETDLIASGFDSLSLVAMLQFIEKKYGLWIPEGDITETTLQNPRTLAALVVRLLNERPSSP
jgi:acyl carrier protein